MKHLTLIISLIAILLLFSIGGMFYMLRQQAIHIDNLQQNQQQLMGDSLNAKFELTKSEFRKQMRTQLDTIRKITGIKPNQVYSVTNINYHYYDSTTIINQSPQLTDTTFDISYKDPCWGFDGTFNIANRERSINNRYATDTITHFTYFVRNRLLGWRWTPRWGSKHYYIKSLSKCKGTTEVKEYKMTSKLY